MCGMSPSGWRGKSRLCENSNLPPDLVGVNSCDFRGSLFFVAKDWSTKLHELTRIKTGGYPGFDTVSSVDS
jgi:hypothetical protein